MINQLATRWVVDVFSFGYAEKPWFLSGNGMHCWLFCSFLFFWRGIVVRVCSRTSGVAVAQNLFKMVKWFGALNAFGINRTYESQSGGLMYRVAKAFSPHSDLSNIATHLDRTFAAVTTSLVRFFDILSIICLVKHNHYASMTNCMNAISSLMQSLYRIWYEIPRGYLNNTHASHSPS